MVFAKSQVPSNKYQEDAPTGKDLVERTFRFAERVRRFVNQLPRTIANAVDVKQLVRSSGSVAANYIESQEGLSRKDFFFRIRICRKEARESVLWLQLLDVGPTPGLAEERSHLTGEADELKRIFAAIAAKDDTGREGPCGK